MAKNKEYELAIKIAGEVEQSFKKSMNLTDRQLKQIARQAVRSSEEIQNTFSTGFDNVDNVLDSFGGTTEKVFAATAAAAAAAAAAVTGIGAAAISVGSSYEAQMSTVASISGATGQDIIALEEKAKEMGETTVFSATEAGQAMEYMAMAGWKTEDMLSGIAGIMNLAAASGEDLATTSDIVTDALTAFGLTAAESTRLADVMAAASSNSNTNVAMMGETFSYVAPIAGSLGYSIEDTSLAIGLLANSGIKSSSAGTALRKIFTETAKGITVSSAALGEFSIATSNSDGSMRELSEILPQLREAFAGMTEQEKALNAESIAGKTAMSGLLALVNASEEDYKKLAGAIDASTGAAERMAGVKIDNLQGDVTLLQSGAEGFGIELYEQMNEALRGGVAGMTDVVGEATEWLKTNNFIEDFSEDIRKNIPTLMRNMKQAGESVAEFADPFMAVGGWIKENPEVIEGALAGIGSTILSMKLITNVSKLAGSFSSLIGMFSNPVTAAVTGVGLAIGGAAGIAAYVTKANKEMAKQNLAEHFGEITLSLEELSEVAAYVIDTGHLWELNEAMQAFDELETIHTRIQDTVAELDKLNWKVSIGMELSADENTAYQDAALSFVEDTQNAILEEQYAMNLNLQLLTDEDMAGEEIRGQFTAFYQNNYETVSELGTKLQAAINDAFSDGLLEIHEAEKIQELQEQIASITEQMAGAEFDAELEVLKMKYTGGELDAESFQNLQAEIRTQAEEAAAQYEEALQINIAKAKVMLEQDAIDQDTYNSMILEFKENYLQQVGDIELRAQSFSLDTIMEQYDEELRAVMPEYQKAVDAILSGYMEGRDAEWANSSVTMWQGLLQSVTDVEGLDSVTADAISKLLEQVAPSTEALQQVADQYNELGFQVPSAFMQGITEAATLGAMADGDESSIWNMLGDTINNSEEYTALLETVHDNGGYIPEQIVNGMEANTGVLISEAQALYDLTKNAMYEKFSEPLNIPVQVNLQTQVNGSVSSAIAQYESSLAQGGSASGKIPGYASGGLITQPTLATFAEEVPEWAIPMDGSKSSKAMWVEAGKMLGMDTESAATNVLLSMDAAEPATPNVLQSLDMTESENAGFSGSISYAPQIIIQGSASKEDIQEATNEAYERFERFMERYKRDEARYAW